VCLIVLAGCRSPERLSPGKIYEDCWLKVNRGDLKGALSETDGAVQSFASPDKEWYWRFTLLKAEILVRQRFSKEALALLEPELPPALRGGELAVWRKLTQGAANAYLFQFEEAGKLLDEAEVLASANQLALQGEVALRRGTLAFLQGSPTKAESEYRKALTISLAQNDRFLEASALGSLGLAATRQEHYDESVDWDRAALQLSRSLGARTSVARILVNLGWSYFELGNYEEALSLFQQTEDSFAQAGAPAMQVKARSMTGLTDYYLRNYAAAKEESQRALELARVLGDKSAVAECLNGLSSIAIAEGQIELARKYNLEAHQNALSGADRDGETAATLISGRIDEADKHFERAEQSLRRVISDLSAATATRWEAEARLAKVYDAAGQAAKAENEYKRSVRTIQAARRSVGQDELRLTFLSSAIDFFDDYIDFLVQHGRFDDALRVADRTRSQTLAEGLASSTKAPVQLSSGLPPRQVAQKLRASLLLYWLGRDQSYLWVITPSKITCLRLPKKSQIEPLVKAYREEVLSGRDVLESDSPEGKGLYEMLIAPADKVLAKTGRIIVLPAEGLYGLNFETLIVPQPKPHYWIEDAIVSEASSLALLSAASQKASSSEKSLLLVGNPETPGPDFPLLPQAAEEIQKVSMHFPEPRRKVLEGRQATASAYLQSNPERFSYLHFVTHGTASQTRPLESAVILTKEGDSYKLYARDIVTHPLKADLVTISACNGAGTRAYAGEGLVGLSWAFLRAGAHNVIASLWEVSDASSTAQLMDALYRDLDHGADPATALRNAKLFILKSNSNTVFRKPFYWAPFELYAGS
jgi:CHAT domain-containing protein